MCNNGKTKAAMAAVAPVKPEGKALVPSHSSRTRNTDYDVLLFLVPALFWKLTPVIALQALFYTVMTQASQDKDKNQGKSN